MLSCRLCFEDFGFLMDAHALNETSASQLLEAYKIARKYFPKTPSADLLEAIELCRAANCLFVEPGIVFAAFRYHPGQIIGGKRMFEIVKDWDIETLKR